MVNPSELRKGKQVLTIAGRIWENMSHGRGCATIARWKEL